VVAPKHQQPTHLLYHTPCCFKLSSPIPPTLTNVQQHCRSLQQTPRTKTLRAGVTAMQLSPSILRTTNTTLMIALCTGAGAPCLPLAVTSGRQHSAARYAVAPLNTRSQPISSTSHHGTSHPLPAEMHKILSQQCTSTNATQLPRCMHQKNSTSHLPHTTVGQDCLHCCPAFSHHRNSWGCQSFGWRCPLRCLSILVCSRLVS
jgi:hypothetical protein